MKRWRRLLIRLVLVAVSVLVCLALAEIGLRLTGFVRDRQWGPVSEVVKQKPSSFSERIDPTRPYLYDFDRIVTDRRSEVTITLPDESRRTFPFAKPPDTFRAIAVGDSLTELWRTPGYRNYTDFLRERLAARSGKRVEVLPLGVGGYNPRGERHWYEERFEGLEGDLLLLQLCPNDIDVVVARPRDAETFDVEGFRGPLPAAVRNGLRGGSKSWPDYDVLNFACAEPDFSRTPLGSRVLWLVGHLWRRYVRGDPYGGLTAVEANDELSEAIAWFRDHAKRKGMRLLAVVFPRLAAGSRQTEARLLLEVLARNGVPAVDLRAALTGEVDPADVRVDSLHPNADGHRRAADAVIEDLERRGWLGASSGR
jgi:lysophospholipase L1-like esterase